MTTTCNRNRTLASPVKALFSLAMAILLTQASPAAAAARYRLAATSYSLTLSTTLQLKNENCKTNFGDKAELLDMKHVKDRYFDNEKEFNQALEAVVFKQPTSAFMVMYDGTDTPPNEDHQSKCYAIKTTPPAKSSPTIDSFGRARVIIHGHEAQVLCVVPAEEESAPKAYVPKEANGSVRKKSGMFSMGNMFILLLVLGIGFVVKSRFMSPNGRPLVPSFTEAYYNLLDNKAHDGPNSDGDLGTNLTEGCELSYNPAIQGMI